VLYGRRSCYFEQRLLHSPIGLLLQRCTRFRPIFSNKQNRPCFRIAFRFCFYVEIKNKIILVKPKVNDQPFIKSFHMFILPTGHRRAYGESTRATSPPARLRRGMTSPPLRRSAADQFPISNFTATENNTKLYWVGNLHILLCLKVDNVLQPSHTLPLAQHYVKACFCILIFFSILLHFALDFALHFVYC
jgi:hypothetical protein